MVVRIQQPAPNFIASAVVKGDFKELSLWRDYKGKHFAKCKFMKILV